MNSTNANSGSEGGYQSSHMDKDQQQLTNSLGKTSRQKKEITSIMHPSSPSKIQIDSFPNNHDSHNLSSINSTQRPKEPFAA